MFPFSKHLGATVFPFLDVFVRPQAGDALFWYNTQRSGEGEPLTMHAGCPVIGGGTKWIANLWLRQHAQMFHRPCEIKLDSS